MMNFVGHGEGFAAGGGGERGWKDDTAPGRMEVWYLETGVKNGV